MAVAMPAIPAPTMIALTGLWGLNGSFLGTYLDCIPAFEGGISVVENEKSEPVMGVEDICSDVSESNLGCPEVDAMPKTSNYDISLLFDISQTVKKLAIARRELMWNIH